MNLLGKPKERKFRWDPHHKQPHTDLSKWEKLWESRFDIIPYAQLLGKNLTAAWPITRRYLELIDQAPGWTKIEPRHLAIALTPHDETWERCLRTLEDLGSTSLLLRLTQWDKDDVYRRLPELADLEGRDYCFPLLQDREGVLDTSRWRDFVVEAAEKTHHLSPMLEIGHAANRKKWGIWRPDEYLDMLEAIADVPARYGQCQWIGPAFIDFEYYYIVNVLFRELPFHFDGISNLLYVDRRGGPDNPQYKFFNLRAKIVLLWALMDASPHPTVPLHLTEFNWCLRDTGKFSSAGDDVQVHEENQASFLAIYYLTAAATGLVASSYWWELVAPGFGLIDAREGWRERPAFHAYRTLLKRALGAEVTPLLAHGSARGFALRRGDERQAFLYAHGGATVITLPPGVEAATFTGEPLSGQRLALDDKPLYLTGSEEALGEVLSALGLGAWPA